jgi:acyl-CoA synthetase (AMP-forming)/AMP-acid ligase II
LRRAQPSPRCRGFEPEALLAAIERHRATFLVVPPPVMVLLARHPAVEGYDLSSVEFLGCGGAPLSAERQREVAARLPHVVVGQGWGMTETSVGATLPDRFGGTARGSVGRVAPSTELRVVDPASEQDLGVNQRGELLVRGPQGMAGYLSRPEDTAEAIDPAGWLRTGDLGVVDRAGDVFIVDRLKELIKVNAYQVAPAELEALLITHPGVADAAVIGRPDERLGEIPVAVVVPRGDELDADGLLAWVAERVAPYKRLGAIRFAEASRGRRRASCCAGCSSSRSASPFEGSPRAPT